MIEAFGVDVIEIERFVSWAAYSEKQLLRIFTETELHYCFAVAACTAERLALRFAAKEAFFKSLSSIDPNHKISFLSMSRHIAVEKDPCGAIRLAINWAALRSAGLSISLEHLKVHVSASHTRVTAFASVIIERLA